ncbi:MAG: riboflavin synthase alpha chain [Bacteroidota bacterium]
MFSGIVESLGIIKDIRREGSNVHFTIQSSISGESYIDQSIAHNGVCLTVVAKTPETHTVTAIEETLIKSNLNHLKINDLINLERSVMANSRMDGHIVQGHVDTTLTCKNVVEADGSWYFSFELPTDYNKLVVPKGSICINGVSLTIADYNDFSFTVAIIPYTFENTNFNSIIKGNLVNAEFDILGKYIVNYLEKIHLK